MPAIAIITILILICLILIGSIIKHQQFVGDQSAIDSYTHELNSLKDRVSQLQYQENDLLLDIDAQYDVIKENQDKLENIYTKVQTASNELNELYETEKARKLKQIQEQVDAERVANEQLIHEEFVKKTNEYNLQVEQLNQAFEELVHEKEQQVNALEKDLEYQKKRYEGLLEPLAQYEKDKQAQLYYTVQIPEYLRADIDYLLTTAANKIQHPDILNKLIWSEYVRPYLEEAFTRISILNQPGIYKLTNINNGKSYIGKSTDIRKRIADHFKGAVGIKSIADQAIHHAMLEEGLWNWMIDFVTYCEKDQLSDLEKYYIDFFKTQEFGYNKTKGG